MPCVFAPPIARCAPWSRRGDHLAVYPSKKDAIRLTSAYSHACRQRRTKHAKAHPGINRFDGRSCLPSFSSLLRFLLCGKKTFHAEFSWPVCIDQFRRTEICFANEPREPRNRQFQFF